MPPLRTWINLGVFALLLSLAPVHSAPPKKPVAPEKPDIREWTITDAVGKVLKIDAELIDGRSGAVRLKKADATELSVTMDMLSDTDRKAVYKKLGMAVVDVAGIWRSDSGSYYTVLEGKDGKVYVILLESPHLASLDGVLLRSKEKLRSEQWIAIFKADTKGRALSGTSEGFVLEDGRVRFRFDSWWIPGNGRAPTKQSKKVVTAFVRLDADSIPAHIFDLYIKRKASRSAEIYANAVNKMKQVIVIDWYSRQRKVSIQDMLNGKGPAPDPGLAELLVNAVSISVRNRIVNGVLQMLFPVFKQSEEDLARIMVFKYLDSRPMVADLNKGAFKKWFEDEIAVESQGGDVETENLVTFTRFMGDVHEEVKKSLIAALP